ncbi:MAG: DUF2163 domain-containing protein [Rhodospirillales bacterium]|nr:MAG: DUF2163 domain-containing protein [Rhodospirillales bacterium]
MKSTSAALAAHLAGPVTTLATCWRITRVDGTEFFFTDHESLVRVSGGDFRKAVGPAGTGVLAEHVELP